nr:hypothetical protein [Halanaerobium congolense]
MDLVSASTGEMKKRYSFIYVDKHDDGSGTLERKPTTNFGQYQQLLATKKAMGDKPVIAVINLDNPMIFKEIDPLADVIK